ncbi:MAG TPA: polyamine aminopropyltransferase [Candidatus Latescibacteria bacterium]|nr:polyamine aminopropyltransferase [Candidatus Latescibacterota bacterium]
MSPSESPMAESPLPEDGRHFWRAALLLAAIFSASACAIIYELLIGSTSAYFLGDSVQQFSVTIGLFLASMGLGSWLSRAVVDRLLERFIAFEMWLAAVGGCSVPVLYFVYLYTGHFRYAMILLIISVGALVGLELPLLTRMLQHFGGLRTVLSNVLSIDYLGSLVAALLFPYLLLPLLGAFNTSLATGLLNVGVGLVLLRCFWSQLMPGVRSRLVGFGVFVFCGLGTMLVVADPIRERLESDLYTDQIIYSERSQYQQIVLTQWQDEVRLYLDRHLQFSSADEYRYHESLVHPAMALAHHPQRVLIIGGGDGLSVREVLRHGDIERVDVVDLDRAVTDLARRDLRLTRLNNNALSRPKVHIFNEDGFTFLERAHQDYGVIIIDLPDPRDEALSKLYSVEAYRLCARHLSPGGVVVTQASSPYYARVSFWSIAATMAASGLIVVPYHTLVPSFGEWGFVVGSNGSGRELAEVNFDVPDLRYMTAELFRQMQSFPIDMSRPDEVVVNRLDRPMLARQYREDWSRW